MASETRGLVHEPFERRAATNPDAVAVVAGDRLVTSAELDAAANGLAAELVETGAGPETTVGVLTRRTPEMVAAILAVLKAGAAYVPLDPDYPPERLRAMVAGACVSTVIAEDGLRPLVAAPGIAVLDPGAEKRASRSTPACRAIASNLAYVIFTSGSTGTPNAVAVTHRAIGNTLRWMQDSFPLLAGDAVAQKTSISFTDSVWELLWTLGTPARLVLLQPEQVSDARILHGMLRKHGVTHTQFVPPQMRAFLDIFPTVPDAHLPRLRWVFNGGEALPTALAERWCRSLPEATIVNSYGMTESAIYATYEVVRPDADGRVRVLIGRPIQGERIEVVDPSGRACPAGVTGELVIGGESLARGYLGAPGLTADRFRPDPSVPGAVRYRTGDVGRRLPDGRLEYVGRADRQVKIRGYRVELGEVENALEAQPGVGTAVVLAVEEAGRDRFLVGYMVASPGTQPDPVRVRAALADRLPEYMIPRLVVELRYLPLTAHGKVDRRALQQRRLPDAPAAPEPATALERLVGRLWQELLGHDIGPGQDVLAAGADSLLMQRFVLRLAEHIGVDLSVATVLRLRSVPAIAAAAADELGDRAAAEELAALALPGPSAPPPRPSVAS